VLYPLEQTNADESITSYVESAYSPYWLSLLMEESMRAYFMQSDKLKDNFWEIYAKYFMSE
jgi:hypothetical protein